MKNTRKDNRKRRSNKRKPQNGNKYIAGAIIAIAALCVFFSMRILTQGASALKNSYNESYSSNKDAAYDQWYKTFYEKAEAENHLSNRLSISIEDIDSRAALEVLKVQDTEFVFEDADDNAENIELWLEVSGVATYVVNLKEAEFVVDSDRNYVLVRAPEPEVSNPHITSASKIFANNDYWDDSIQDGKQITEELENKGLELLREEFETNRNYRKNAIQAAEGSLQRFVMQLNPDVDNITVDVEFFDVNA